MTDRTPLLPLAGVTVVNHSAQLAGELCAEHLAFLGARTQRGDQEAGCAGALRVHGAEEGEIECRMPWQDSDGPASEATIQAISGLMGIHSSHRETPIPLGLEVVSAATGILATQGVLAALLARRRGLPTERVTISALDGALVFLRHHLAIATCSGTFPFSMPEAGARPPFCSGDGHWFEIEALSGESWKAFWARLGLAPLAAAGEAWLPYVYRYLSGRCQLPIALHEATRRHRFQKVSSIARELGVGLCPVRTYPELLAACSLETLLAPPWTVTSNPRLDAPTGAVATSPTLRPLSGLRVVEATSRLQGPLVGLLLGMLGAEVTKVEPPGGDFGRHSPPLAGSMGAAYLAYNRGKSCLEIDYKSSAGLSQLRGLLADADVFIHNWRPGRAEQLGLDAAAVRGLNPSLVYAEASGWGSHPPPCPIAGDFLVQAYAACGDGLKYSDEPPFPSPLTLVDVMGGLVSCEGILGALYARERTGCGAKVETSLFSAAMWLQASRLRSTAGTLRAGRSIDGGAGANRVQLLRTSEGFLVIDDPLERVASRPRVEELDRRTAREWESLLQAAGIAAAEVRTELRSLPSDPRFAGHLIHVEEGCFMPAPPWCFTPAFDLH
jgi:crotonobetainyl-CoA:carnitine CoA-transferase CaiB-like acyl-CoA transferase